MLSGFVIRAEQDIVFAVQTRGQRQKQPFLFCVAVGCPGRFAELFVHVHTDAFMDGGVLIWKVHIVFIIFVKMEEYSPVQRDVQLNVIVLIAYEIGGRGRRFVVKGYAVFSGKGESTGTGKAGVHETFRLFETGERGAASVSEQPRARISSDDILYVVQ